MADLIYRPAPAPLPPPPKPPKSVEQAAWEQLSAIHEKARGAPGQETVGCFAGAVVIFVGFGILWPVASFVGVTSALIYWNSWFAFFTLVLPCVILPILVVFYLTTSLWATWLVATGNVKELSPLAPVATRVDGYYRNPHLQYGGEWAWIKSRGWADAPRLDRCRLLDHLQRFLKDMDANASERADFMARPMEERIEIACKRALYLELSGQVPQ
jgi:hypothetical protein